MLEIKNVSKTYAKEEKKALDHVSFTINKGEFTALLGHNGAGKTTLINILGGNVNKTEGKLFVEGLDLDKHGLPIKKLVGIVPQEINFDFLFTVNEILKTQSGYFGLKNNQDHIDEILEHLGLTEKKHATARALSGGMRRRLLIAKALVHKPKLLILDEPTAGVDMELRRSLYGYLRQLHASGITIILTTHYLEEAENLCGRIIILDKGKLLIDENKEKLLSKSAAGLMEFHFDKEFNVRDFAFLSEFGPEKFEGTKLRLRVEKKDVPLVISRITDNNIHYRNFKMENTKLEDVYMNLMNERRAV